MNLESIYKKDGKYFLNEHQYFIVYKDILKQNLKKISFPCIILDTEFINKSHFLKEFEQLGAVNLNSDEEATYLKNIIITINFSFARNYEDILKRDNQKAIKSIKMVRKKKMNASIFYEQYRKLIYDFINIVNKKNIKTLVFAGKANDEAIINEWFEKIKFKFKPKILITNSVKSQIKAVDIYDTLESSFEFSNVNNNGEQFVDPKNYGVNTKNNLLKIKSQKTFFEYFKSITSINFEEDEKIYDLCCQAYYFFAKENLNEQEFNKGSLIIKSINMHCKNDVLKSLLLIKFFCLAKKLS
ncbi:hypothetical protein [Spiroplasma endosymbiont of Labia minor]|uniref:hypothetical protein n=1 Tax=Spiroplasma endosymbiont of Labia minor TaxID=3066305 RepID=UPI0030D17974